MEIKDSAIFHRTSVRQYLDKAVEPEKIETLLRAGMAAPSAGNQQPWEFYVVTDAPTLAALAGCSPYAGCAKAAPLAFVLCTKTDLPLPEYAEIDASAAAENLLLAADALGLGAVWLGIAPEPERMDAVRRVLALPDTLNAFAILPCGYPAEPHAQQNRFDPARVHYIG